MPLKTLVKVSTITNLSDARYCAGMGVDMLGFNVVENTDNFVSSKDYQDIRGWISGPKFVAEIYSFNNEILSSILENYIPDFLEFDLVDLARLPENITTPLIVSVSEVTFKKYGKYLLDRKSNIAYVIIKKMNADETFDTELRKEFPTLLLPPDTKKISLSLDPNLSGIVLSGTHEIRPGLKDYDHLADILEQLEME